MRDCTGACIQKLQCDSLNKGLEFQAMQNVFGPEQCVRGIGGFTFALLLDVFFLLSGESHPASDIISGTLSVMLTSHPALD